MMNPEDALGLQEDLAILRSGEQHRRSQEPLPTGGPTQTQRNSLFAMAIQQKDIDQLTAQLRDSNEFRSDLAAVIMAYREELFDVLDLLAQKTGYDKDVLRNQSSTRLSRRYDAHVEQFKAQGAIKKDQRKNPEVMKHRTWYIEP